MKLTLLTSLALCLIAFSIQAQSFGIGTDAPDPQAILDIVSTDRGVFIPRMTTAQRDASITPSLNATDEGLFIYNNDDTAFNYWDGTQWVVFGSSSNDDWTILGNAGTAAGTNFIGTTDAVDFVMRTSNTEKARITSAGNFGIGTPTPVTKLNVVQSASAIGIEVDHTGATGNSMVLFPQNPANTSSALWIFNSSGGRGINVSMLNGASNAVGAEINQSGFGIGMLIDMNNSSNNAQGLFIDQVGRSAFSRGIEISMDPASIAGGSIIFQDGTGTGQFISIGNATSTGVAQWIEHTGLGFGYYAAMTNTGANRQGLLINQNGSGGFSRGSEVSMTTTTTAFGSGVFQNGTGIGSYIDLGNVATVNPGQYIIQGGLGDGQVISLDEATNTANGNIILHAGDGTGQYIGMTNASATNNSMGLLVVYEATAGGTAGGGNVAEFQHNGTNGNAVDIFIGDPALAPGPANTTSEYAGLSIAHMATGTGTAGTMSAISASNNSADPTVVINNDGNEAGSGLLSVAEPNGVNDPTAVDGYSYEGANEGYGIGVRGIGGWYGVHAWQNGTNFAFAFGLYTQGDLAATGVKSFIIDYPLDPENKALRHYAIESNEVLNVYRGIAKINSKGFVVVELPEYFNAVNTNPTYQLTTIGTPHQAYIKKEVSGNQFVIAGKPNSKVSWEIQANRNDPTIQYYDKNGKNYAEEVFDKPDRMKGKYYTPEAYGKDKTMGIHYDEAFEKRVANMDNLIKSQKAMDPKVDKVERQKQGPKPDVKVEQATPSRENNDDKIE